MDEFDLIRRYFDRPVSDDSVRHGVGDDGAVLVPDAGSELVTVIDTLVEGVHFPAGLQPEAIGYRSVAVNLSDVAAMGARPRWMTLALTLVDANETWLEGFAQGLYVAAQEHDVSLVGGDTTRGSQTVISIQIIGDIDAGMSIRRSGASPGDLIFVSGTTGDAAAGLALMNADDVSTPGQRFLVDRFCRPTARVSLGRSLAGVASAAIDVSDGLISDALKMLTSSRVGGYIEADRLPMSSALKNTCSDDDALQFALTGGDDYELCFTVRPADEQTVMMLSEQCNVPVARIGEVQEGSGLSCTRAGNKIEVDHGGYRHF